MRGYEGGKLRICHVENEALADKIADMIKRHMVLRMCAYIKQEDYAVIMLSEAE